MPIRVAVKTQEEESAIGFLPTPHLYDPPFTPDELHRFLYSTNVGYWKTVLFLTQLAITVPCSVYILSFRDKTERGEMVVASPLPKMGLLRRALLGTVKDGKEYTVLFPVTAGEVPGGMLDTTKRIAMQAIPALQVPAGTALVCAAGATMAYAAITGGVGGVATTVLGSAVGATAYAATGALAYLRNRKLAAKRVDTSKSVRGLEHLCNTFGWVEKGDDYFCVYGLRLKSNLLPDSQKHWGWGGITYQYPDSSLSPQFWVSGVPGKNTIEALSVFSRMSGARITVLDLRRVCLLEIQNGEVQKQETREDPDFYWFVDIEQGESGASSEQTPSGDGVSRQEISVTSLGEG
jgi:hypothetical protein